MILAGRLRAALDATRAASARQRQLLLGEMQPVKGLIPLLMKRRNNQYWTAADRVQLAALFKQLRNASPYLAIISLPGGFLLLPAFAWWLDRRSRRRDG